MYRNMCIFVGVLSVVYALGYTLAPMLTASFYLPNANADTALMGRYFAVSLWFSAIVCWLLRDCTDVLVRRAVSFAGIISAGLGLIISVVFTVNGQMSMLGWGPVIIYLVAAVGWFIVLRASPRATTT